MMTDEVNRKYPLKNCYLIVENVKRSKKLINREDEKFFIIIEKSNFLWTIMYRHDKMSNIESQEAQEFEMNEIFEMRGKDI
ncbi:MAG: hypothetical protein ABH869_01315 [Candidatus Omnitrophota bacterium]